MLILNPSILWMLFGYPTLRNNPFEMTLFRLRCLGPGIAEDSDCLKHLLMTQSKFKGTWDGWKMSPCGGGSPQFVAICGKSIWTLTMFIDDVANVARKNKNHR